VLVSFGRTFPVLYDPLFALLPFFNKFRAPAMILHLLPFLLGILGAAGLGAFLDRMGSADEARHAAVRKAVQRGALAFGVLALLALLLKGGLFDAFGASAFTRANELEDIRRQYGSRAGAAITQLGQTRFDLLWKDLVKFLVLGTAALAVVAAFLRGALHRAGFLAAMVAILVVDLFLVASKYIDPKPATELERSFAADATVQYLKQQPGRFRIFPVGQLFMDNAFATHGLESIGGYSPAKLKVYQSLLDSALYTGPDPEFPLNMNVVNMLNVEYIIALGRLPEDRFQLASVDQARRALTYRNPGALPRAWYVGDVRVADDHEALRTVASAGFNPRVTAVVDRPTGGAVAAPDSGVSPQITEYRSRQIVLRSVSPVQTLLVLSEIYYPAGWTARIDGQETPILRTNYALRSVVVPAGSHDVVFRFDPPLYALGYTISIAGWLITAGCIGVGLWRSPSVRQRFARKP
jgi:hypothetical protein